MTMPWLFDLPEGEDVSSGASPTNRPADDAGELRARADRGEADAQYELGIRCSNGRGAAQDERQATAWFRKAAAQGHADAQYCLAMNYHHGLGLPADDVQAVLWYCRAAENEHAEALFALGCMYALGRGVPEDFVEAYTWVSLGVVRACGPDKKLYTGVRTALTQCMTRRQITEARTLARLWAEAFEKRTTERLPFPGPGRHYSGERSCP